MKDRVRRNQRTQKETSDRDARTRRFQAGDRVLCRNFTQGPKWVAGTVLVGDGASVRVKMDDGRVWRRHVKTTQLESQPGEQSESSSTGSPEDPLSVPLEDRSVEREDTSGTEAEPTENHSENVRRMVLYQCVQCCMEAGWIDRCCSSHSTSSLCFIYKLAAFNSFAHFCYILLSCLLCLGLFTHLSFSLSQLTLCNPSHLDQWLCLVIKSVSVSH